jgi:Nucleotidyl transferase AbiEii toxin, Type IV TA system
LVGATSLMRTISNEQWLALEDLSAQGLLEGLPPQTAEKDIHVTDLLNRLSTLEVRHDHFQGRRRGEPSVVDDGIKLIFAGGTCLSKAYGLINRMSEDIDIKVVLGAPTRKLKKDAGNRSRLKAMCSAIDTALTELEFELPSEMDERVNPRIRDKYRHYVIGARYAGRGAWLPSLRPDLKLEVIHREPRLNTPLLQFGYLHERIAKLKPSALVSFHCVNVAETLAEKVLSLLRRCAWNWGGQQKRVLDPTLVRHVYDVFRIMISDPDQINLAADVFKSIVNQDTLEFKGQNPEFDANPHSVLLKTLEAVRTSEVLQAQYSDRVMPLIYEGAKVSYREAYAQFELAAIKLLA